ncbi:MAG: hypothetical protein R3F34_05440, partial [Planctomycetota bacterium]
FRFAGLASGEYRIRAEGGLGTDEAPLLADGWVDVEAGATDVDVVLKRRDDVRDVGCHAAEIHGRVVRASDGAPVEVDFWSVDADLVRLDEGVDLERDWLPNHVFPRPVQRSASGPLPAASDGFHLTGLGAGTYVVRCTRRGSAIALVGPITLADREIARDVVIRLADEATVAGTVVGPDGGVVDGAWVFLTGVGPLSDALVAGADREYREASGRGFFFVNGTGRRAAGGAFELGALPAGVPFRLVALHPDREPLLGEVLVLEPGERREVDPLRFGPPR